MLGGYLQHSMIKYIVRIHAVCTHTYIYYVHVCSCYGDKMYRVFQKLQRKEIRGSAKLVTLLQELSSVDSCMHLAKKTGNYINKKKVSTLINSSTT